MEFISICYISFLFLLMLSFFLLGVSLLFLINSTIIFFEWEVVSMNSMSLIMTFLFDWMSLMFMSFVLFISSLVILYSKEYMEMEKNLIRFIMLVLLFVLSMMFLIISPNLISVLLGWDGLGLVSYCLVIYFQNVKSYNAGMLTALSNRVGDVAILMAIAWMLNYGGWSFYFYLDFIKGSVEGQVISMLVVLAAMTKSAQIPFSSWLPAAMAAPTPVSALVHSSTLVTAGVYLLIRFNELFKDSFIMQFLLVISGLTMFMSGLGANFEFDLKKIIALSTLSQLGLMMMILSMGFADLAFFHLLMHALFKALLFMCAGSIIHNMMNNQDIRFMGGLCFSMPLTAMIFNIANLALCGMPFLAGFYSKDLILEKVSMLDMNMLLFFFFFFSTGLTVAYSFRLVYYSMSGVLNMMSNHCINDYGKLMQKSMSGLFFMSVIAGSMISWLVFPSPYMICLSFYLKYLTLFVCLLGGMVGYLVSYFYYYFYNFFYLNYNFTSFLGMMWFMPVMSTFGVIKYPLMMGVNSIKSFEFGWSEMLGGQMIYNSMKFMSIYKHMLYFNNLKIYLISFFMWIILLFMFMYL
uniref:NADH-ubiquinone oxidoreductase chain 5 n=1 Tax=Orfelia nemoralis TaxID=1588145 RepID=A0A7S6R1W9_9DIPT|nr:NADH dehydrogenase subunit 5 [Orfelia nemoralis]